MPNYPLSNLYDDVMPSALDQQRPYPKNWIMEFTDKTKGTALHGWSCLRCGHVTKKLSHEMSELSMQAHAMECSEDIAVAAARHDLLGAIVMVDEPTYLRRDNEAHFGAGLIQRGGLWELIANEIGWPNGYHGEDGWFANYAEARDFMQLPESYSSRITDEEK